MGGTSLQAFLQEFEIALAKTMPGKTKAARDGCGCA